MLNLGFSLIGKSISLSQSLETNNGIPDGLGRGYLSTADDLRALLVPPDGAEPPESARNTWFSVEFVDDRSSFASTLAVSAKAKFGFSGGGASARVSMSRSFRKSMRSIDLILTKIVQTRKFFLRDPHFRPEALEFFKERGAQEFAQRFGDSFIRSVTMGGLMSLVYRLDFRTAEETADFQASAKGGFGGASGGASVHSTLLKSATRASITMTGITSGVMNAPPFFVQSQGVDKKTAKISANDQLADAMIAYFDNFEEAVTSESEVAVTLEPEESTSIVNAPPEMVDLSPINELIADGAELDDVIDERLAEVDYMRDVALSWNTQVVPASLVERRETLLRLSDRLDSALGGIARLTDPSPTLPFSREDVPANPDNWRLKQLKEVATVRKKALNNKAVATIQLPNRFPGQPAEVELVVSHRGLPFSPTSVSTAELVWELADGESKSVFEPTRFTNPVPRSEAKKIVIPLEGNFQTLRLSLESRGAQLQAVLTLRM